VISFRPPLVSVLVASAMTLILLGRPEGPLAAEEGAFRSVARSAFVPVESAGDAALGPLAGAVSGLGRARDLVEAEAAVERERTRAASETARADALAAENGRLAALLGLDGPSGGEGVAARVVSTPVGSSGGTLAIDRGAAAGIRVGMPVVAAGGLVGRIVEVGPRHSTVLPLTDPASAVGVRCAPAEPPGGAAAAPAAAVAQGVGGWTLRLDLFDPTAPLRSGDLAVTSGLRHSRFPAGLPVGRVTGSRGRFGVEPFAPPDRLELVKVLRWEPEP
jgi:rod shape-determining protein MreC